MVATAPPERLLLAYWHFSYDASDLCRLLVCCSSTLMELSLAECRVRDREIAVDSTKFEASVPPVVHLGALREFALVDNIDV